MQLPLLPYENLLKRRFNSAFFRSIPTGAGVYFFKDQDGQVLYVGKAKNLRKRLQSYKQIKPERGPRKMLRMIFRAHEISWEQCPDETQAYLKENHYLSQLKPPFNRMNTRPEYYFYLNLKIDEELKNFHFTFDREADGDAWRVFGAFKSRRGNQENLEALLQLYRFLIQQAGEFWLLQGHKLGGPVHVEYLPLLMSFLGGESQDFLQKCQALLLENSGLSDFERYRLEQASLRASDFYHRVLCRQAQMLESGQSYVPKEKLDDVLVLSRQKK